MRTAQSAARALFAALMLCRAIGAQADPPVDVIITRADGVAVHLTAEIADSEEERRRGLMERASLPARHGMWFDFGATQQVSMWMKNTLVPLDILFIDDTLRVLAVRRGTPHDTTLIRAPGPVRFVLELEAGVAAAFGLAPGNRVSLRRR